MVGIIDKIKNRIPISGEPESDVSADDIPVSDDGDGDSGSGGSSNSSETEEEQDNSDSNSDPSSEDPSEERDQGKEEGSENQSTSTQEEDQHEEKDNKKFSNTSLEEYEDLDEEEVEETKQEMESEDPGEDMSSWMNSNGDTDIPEFIDSYYEDVQEQRSEPETEIESRIEDRENKIDNNYVKFNYERVVDEYEDRFAREIEKAFKQIKSRGRPNPAKNGSRINFRGLVRNKINERDDSDRLYLDMDKSELGNRAVCVVVDCSDSMDELEAKLALYSLAMATREINDDLVVTSYTTEEDTGVMYNEFTPRTQLVTAPGERFRKEHLDSFQTNGYTPMASGIEDGIGLLKNLNRRKKIMIVITDGIANVDMDGNRHRNTNLHNKAIEESKNMVNAALSQDIALFGLGVGEHLDEKYVESIFGENYLTSDMDNIADRLIEIYKSQMRTVQDS